MSASNTVELVGGKSTLVSASNAVGYVVDKLTCKCLKNQDILSHKINLFQQQSKK